ncbi:MAG TPA: FlgD immunoglobulin-like domain containing protein [bacterium]
MCTRVLLFILLSLLIFANGFSVTPGPIVISKFTVDDDEDDWADDNSEGDGDKVAEQGEKIRLDVFLKNEGSDAVTGVQATMSTTSSWVIITKATINYGDLAANTEKSSAGTWRDGFHFTVKPDAPSGNISFTFQITSTNAGSFTGDITVAIDGGGSGGPVHVTDVALDDDEETWPDDKSNGDGDGLPEYGETVRMVVTLKNKGTAPAFDVTATLSASITEISITNPVAQYKVIGDGASENNAGIWRNGFHFIVNLQNTQEQIVDFYLDITTRYTTSFRDTIHVTIGPVGVPGPLVIEFFSLDDDEETWADDKSKGDGDGIAEQGETIRVPITLKNEGTATVFDVNATLTTTSEYITITEATADYGVLGEGESKSNEGTWRDGFHFRVHSDAQSADVLFILNITTSNAGAFADSFKVSIVGGGMVGPIEISSFIIDDDNDQWADDISFGNGDGIINDSEVIRLGMYLINLGTATALDVSGTLSTKEPLINITQPTKAFTTIGGGEKGDNIGIWRNGFHFQVAESIPRKNVTFYLAISTSDGKSFSDSLIVTIGSETDQSPPKIVFRSPSQNVPVPVRRFPVDISFNDGLYGSGIDTTSLRITLNRDIGSDSVIYAAGADLSELFQQSVSTAYWLVADSLEFPLGENILRVTIADKFGNTGEINQTFTTTLFGMLNAADSAYVNSSPFTLIGYAVQKYVAAIKVNSVNVPIAQDQFQTDVNLSAGANVITVTAFDQSASEIGTAQFTLFFDNIAPLLSIQSPLNGAIIEYSPVTFRGAASDQAPFKLLMNGRKIEVENGTFEEESEIDEGEKIFRFVASDSAGNQRELNWTVIGKPPESPAGKLLLYLKDDILSKFKYEPYPPNTTMGFRVNYVFDELVLTYVLTEDIPGNEYEFSLLAGCYGLGSAIMEAELCLMHQGAPTVLAKTPSFTGSMAGQTPFGYTAPSRKSFTVTGIDPDVAVGDTLLLRISKIGGDRMGMIFTQELNRGHSYITIPHTATDVNIARADLPTVFRLHQNYPNPFNPDTFIQYELPVASMVKLEIYNLMGQRVKTLINEKQPAGFYSVHWNGTDDSGCGVASGMYLYRWETIKAMQVRKLTLLR